jgi:hypothetical protein
VRSGIRIAVIAAALAFLVAAARESEKYHCGNPFFEAATILFLLAVGYPLARAMARAYRWTPPPPKEAMAMRLPRNLPRVVAGRHITTSATQEMQSVKLYEWLSTRNCQYGRIVRALGFTNDQVFQ